MNSAAPPTLWRGSLAMAAGLFVGVLAWISIDVALAEARIDAAEPSTWPNMAPAIRFMLVPELVLFFLPVAIIVNAALGIGVRRKLPRLMHWAILGLAYSLPALSLALSHGGIHPRLALVLTSTCTISSAWLVVSRFGGRRGTLANR